MANSRGQLVAEVAGVMAKNTTTSIANALLNKKQSHQPIISDDEDQTDLIASVLATIVSCILLYTHGLPVFMIYTLLFLFGVCCGPHPLCFTLSKENNPHEISGTTVAFANFLIMMGGFIFQPIVGTILDFLWDGSLDEGIRIYSAQNYTTALSIIPIGLFLSIILTLFIRETYHRAVEEASRIEAVLLDDESSEVVKG